MDVGDVVSTNRITIQVGNEVFRGSAGYSAKPGRRMLFLFLGDEAHDESDPLDVPAVLGLLGWQRTPEFQAEVEAEQKRRRALAEEQFAATGKRQYRFFYSWTYRRPRSTKRHNGEIVVEGNDRQDAEGNFAARTADRRDVQVLRIVEVVRDGEAILHVPATGAQR